MQEIEKIIDFIVELEKLKGVLRKTQPVGLGRYENSAEHSWHVCLSALLLKDYANEPVDINRVIKMLLLHDIGEIDAGDKIIYESETPEYKKEEEDGVMRILSLLPDEMGEDFMALWREFESGDTPESRFAKAIDRVPPLLHNVYGQGHSWKKHGINKEKVFSVNQRIEKGSDKLWSVMRSKLENAIDAGILE